jgi:isoquinoline 1-oxidoreductase beta subunit
LPGVIAVVIDRARDFVGVVAATPRALDRALEEIDVAWETPPVPSRQDVAGRVDVDHGLAAGGGALEHRILGDAVSTEAPWEIDLRVDLPALHHAAQEPRAAVARFGRRDGTDIVEIWTGSQDVFVNRNKAAAELGWSTDRVIVHLMRAGGAFGGRALYDVVRDAVLLARAVNRPVKVQWSRADEFLADRARPPSSHRIRMRADETGRITDWWHAVVGGYVVLTEFLAPPWLLAPVRLAVADFGATRGIVPPYAAVRRRVEFADLDLPLHVGPWRSLGATPNNTAIEVAIDAFARKLGRDPVEVRLKNLPPTMARLAACLEKVRGICEAVPRPGVEGFGRGYACGVFHDHSFVAAAFDVVVDRTNKRIRPLRACCVLDVGLAINPDRIKAQTEGCIMMAVGQVLMEAAPIHDIGFSARHFGDYPTPRLADSPRFEIDIIHNPQTAPAGVGETALVAAVPALANAISDATGRPIMMLPIRWDDVDRGPVAG